MADVISSKTNHPQVTATAASPVPVRLFYPSREAFVRATFRRDGVVGVFVVGRTQWAPGTPVDMDIVIEQPAMVLHASGVVRWRRIAGSPKLPAGSAIVFAPKSYHILGTVLDFTRREGPRALVQRPRRFLAAVNVRCVAPGVTLEAQTRDVSKGGLFITDDAPVEVGTLVSLRMVDRRQLPLDVDGVVAWRVAKNAPHRTGDSHTTGFGVRFLLRNPTIRASVHDWVEDVQRLVGPPALPWRSGQRA